MLSSVGLLSRPPQLLGCLLCISTKLCWVGKHVTIITKPTNSPTQGQPNPRKNRLKVAIGPLFPTANDFSWVEIEFISETDYKKPSPPTFSAYTLLSNTVKHCKHRLYCSRFTVYFASVSSSLLAAPFTPFTAANIHSHPINSALVPAYDYCNFIATIGISMVDLWISYRRKGAPILWLISGCASTCTRSRRSAHSSAISITRAHLREYLT